MHRRCLSGRLDIHTTISFHHPQVSDMRISYERGGLSEEDFLGSDPMDIWDTWFKQAVQDKVFLKLLESGL